MSVKGCRRLQLIAMILFIASLLFCLAAIPLQGPLKRLMSAPYEVLQIRSIPWNSLLGCLVHTVLAVLFYVIIRKPLTRSKSRAAVIVFAILLGVLSLLGSFTGTIISTLIGRFGGAAAIVSYSTLEGSVSLFCPVLRLPACVLMLLAMGGICGKDLSDRPAQDREPWAAWEGASNT